MNRRDTARAARIVRLHSEGKTLLEIGDEYGITRERVRQILKREGVTREHGGRAKRLRDAKMIRAFELNARRSQRLQPVFGCDWDTYVAMNDGSKTYNHPCPANSYVSQRNNALKRGISWEITFPEWCRVWEESGHWAERGRTGSSYVMSRLQDFGPYAVWNVYITTLAQNAADYQAELKARGIECIDGFRRLPEKAIELGVAA